MTISIRNQYCPNPSCSFYEQVLAANVIIHSQHARRMRCNACKKTWVAHRHEAHYKLRSEPEKIARAQEMLRHGCSIRQTARLVGASTSTIQRWKARI